MTADAPPEESHAHPLPEFAELEALRELPPRRPADPPAPASVIQWTLVEPTRYEVTICGATAGFIDVVGAVYVVLAGERYSRAVELWQTLVFDDALHALAAAS